MSQHTTTAAQAHQFDDAEQQQEAATLGMWIFLATEVLFFGAILLGYAVYRGSFFDTFGQASRHLDVALGTLNTAILLCSSLTVALGVGAAKVGNNRAVAGFLSLTIMLGSAFLAVKFYEYYQKYGEGLIPGATFSWKQGDAGHASLFFLFYFILTGIHALHMIIGIGVMLVLLVLAWNKRFSSSYYTPMDLGGLYWHFVDIVWVFLFPLLYLVDRVT